MSASAAWYAGIAGRTLSTNIRAASSRLPASRNSLLASRIDLMNGARASWIRATLALPSGVSSRPASCWSPSALSFFSSSLRWITCSTVCLSDTRNSFMFPIVPSFMRSARPNVTCALAHSRVTT